jgi:hypothetical protein
LISPSGYKILTFGLGASFFFSRKINSEDTFIPQKEGKLYVYVEGLHYLFILLKEFKYEITLGFQQKQSCM